MKGLYVMMTTGMNNEWFVCCDDRGMNNEGIVCCDDRGMNNEGIV